MNCGKTHQECVKLPSCSLTTTEKLQKRVIMVMTKDSHELSVSFSSIPFKILITKLNEHTSQSTGIWLGICAKRGSRAGKPDPLEVGPV